MIGIITLLIVSMIPSGAMAAVKTQDVFSNGNLLINPSFEQTQNPDENDGNPFVAWKSDNVPVADAWAGFFPAGEARTNKLAATSWCGVGYTLTLSQKVKVETAGAYEASIWISRGPANLGDTILSIKSGNTVIATTKIGGVKKNDYTNYRQLKISDVNIPASGDYTFELVSVVEGPVDEEGFNSNPFLRIDDAFFGVKVDDGNMLKNPVFDQLQDPSENDGNAFAGWVSDSVPVQDSWTACFPAGEGLINATAATAWCGVGYTLTVAQEVDITEAGKYDASIWISRGPAKQGEATLSVKSGSTVIASTKIAGSGKNDFLDYRQLLIKGFEVPAAGKYKFELVAVVEGPVEEEGFNNNPYLRVDNAYFGKHFDDGNKLKNQYFTQTQDPSENDGNSFVGWVSDSVPSEDAWTACFPAGEGMVNGTAATSWCSVGYILTVSQNVDISQAGKYDASIWISRGPAKQGEVTLSIKSGNDVIAKETIGGGSDYFDYRNIVIKDVEIPSAGTYTFELMAVVSGPLDTPNSNPYLRVDNAYFGSVGTAGTSNEAISTGTESNSGSQTTVENKAAEETKVKNPKTSDNNTYILITIVLMVLSAAVIIKSRKLITK